MQASVHGQQQYAALASVKSPAVADVSGSSPSSSKPEQQADVWTIHISKSTGKKYYHNAETEESTYDRPDGMFDHCQKHPECLRGFLHRGRCTRTVVPQVGIYDRTREEITMQAMQNHGRNELQMIKQLTAMGLEEEAVKQVQGG